MILTRYGRDDDTVVAGILHDVIEDCIRDGYTRQMLEQRIGDKFGANVLDTVAGRDLSPPGRRWGGAICGGSEGRLSRSLVRGKRGGAVGLRG